MRVLAGDIGGTKTLLAMVDVEEGRCNILRQQRYSSHAYPTLTDVIATFLHDGDDKPHYGCLALAGPVSGELGHEQTCQLTNLPWKVNNHSLAEAIGMKQLGLLNDFAAVAWGIDSLQAQDLHTLQTGKPQTHGTRVVLGAGTGLGLTYMTWDGQGHRIHATEGGHSNFAPYDQESLQLLSYLNQSLDPVSWEHLLSGAGLMRLYRFMRESMPHQGTPNVLDDDDPAASISRLALSGEDPLAVRALDLFCRLYGAMAGDTALTLMSTGGLYIGGGIAPQILTKLRDGQFIKAFNHKGPMAHLAGTIPVSVILCTDTAIAGAAIAATHL